MLRFGYGKLTISVQKQICGWTTTAGPIIVYSGSVFFYIPESLWLGKYFRIQFLAFGEECLKQRVVEGSLEDFFRQGHFNYRVVGIRDMRRLMRFCSCLARRLEGIVRDIRRGLNPDKVSNRLFRALGEQLPPKRSVFPFNPPDD